MFGLMMVPGISLAQVYVIPRVSLATSDYNFSQGVRSQILSVGGQTIDFPEVKFDVNFFMLGVGVTFFQEGKYLDLYYQTSSDESDTFEFPEFDNYSEALSGDRTDYSVTVGMKVLENKGAIYGGYKVGDSGATGSGNATGGAPTILNFKEDGFFIGVNYSYKIMNGQISANLAFAALDGSLQETNSDFEADFQTNLDSSSSAKGLSYGLTWSHKLIEQFTYNVGVDANKYTFKDVSRAAGRPVPPAEFEEKFLTLKFSVSKVF